jgi:predicted PurR-regulated permease PerM
LSIAFLIALILDPVVDRLEARGFSRTMGAAIIFGGFVVLAGGLLYASVPALMQQGEQIQKQVTQAVPDSSPDGIDKMLADEGISPRARGFLEAIISNARSSIQRTSGVFTGRLFEYASDLIWLVIVPIVAFYALRDFHIILGKMLLLVSKRRRDLVQAAVSEVTAVFARYMRGLAIVSTLNGLATWLLLWALGVPSSLVLGLVAGVLYSVPYLGALITVIVISVVSFLAGGVNFMLVVLVANVILHQIIFDQIVTPRILGKQVGLHPILAIVALLAGNALLGLIGMILAVPVAACIQIGVLALIPKLKQEIGTAIHEHEANQIGEETKEQQRVADATKELHNSIGEVVEEIEKSTPVQEERRASVLSRRKSRAHDAGRSNA